MRKSVWDRDARLKLESLLKQGYSLSQVADKLGLTRTTVRAEVVRGITDEEQAERRWAMYRASRAMMNVIIEDVGVDAVEQALAELNEEWSEHDRSNDNGRTTKPVCDAGSNR